MNSRERVVTALNHKEPDKVPLDIGGTDSSGITATAYNRLRKHLNLPAGRTEIIDTYGQIVRIEDDIREVIKPDTDILFKGNLKWKPFVLSDGSQCRIPEKWNPEKTKDGAHIIRNKKGMVTARMPKGGYYFDSVNAPLSQITDAGELKGFADEIESYDFPAHADESLDDVAIKAEKMFENTDLAVVANLGGHLLAAGQNLFGYERFMMDLLTEKKLAHAFLEMLTNAYMDRYDRYLDKVGEYIQIVLINDDLGIQTGPMLSLECYKEMIWPYQKKLFQFIKSKADVFLLLHSCGSVYKFIPLLIEAGADALNPIQMTAADMDTKKLKDEFGRDMTFWGGGCDTQKVLCNGSAEQVKEEVKRRISDLAPGGGFVFTQVHNIQPDVPPENIMAMIEAFNKYRGY